MDNDIKIWKVIYTINKKLDKELLCIPLCYGINIKYIQELIQVIEDNEKIKNCIIKRVSLPWQRAYQMEYRYKHISIFKPFLKVLEYATYDFLSGNLVCSYLSLIPIIEAILRTWAEETPDYSFYKIHRAITDFLNYYKDENNKININGELKKCFEHEINYMENILMLFYDDFDGYKKHNFSDTFNRNLSLHKLEGITNHKEIILNLSRLYLLIDIIANLYMISEYDKYFKVSLYADFNNKDFQFRWKFYKLLSIKRLKLSDINLLEYYLNNDIDEDKKEQIISKIDENLKL